MLGLNVGVQYFYDIIFMYYVKVYISYKKTFNPAMIPTSYENVPKYRYLIKIDFFLYGVYTINILYAIKHHERQTYKT